MTETSEQVADALEECERLGDNAFGERRLEEALDHYEAADGLFMQWLDETAVGRNPGVSRRLLEAFNRCAAKLRDIRHESRPTGTQEPDYGAKRDAAIDSGDLAHASHMSFRLGEACEELGDSAGAESAYREAVALARQVDAADPELMLAAFVSLIGFLSPSEESVALAAEMGRNLIGRRDMYHPMRAAEAAGKWALAELAFAEVAPHRVDDVIDGIAQQAIDMCNDVCFHGEAQSLQRQVAAVLRSVGRDTDADRWQADADRYGDWEVTSEQQIPGHVHLWDIRFDLSDLADEDQ